MDTELTDEEKAQFEAIKNDKPIEEEKEEEKSDDVSAQEKEEAPQAKEPERKTVPLEALHEERLKRKELQKRLDELSEKFARADERAQILGKPKETPPPDPEEDPIGHQAWRAQQIEKQLQERTKTDEEDRKKLARELENIKYKQFIDHQERNFERSNPDYEHALKHFVKSQRDMLQDIGLEEEEIQREIDSELARIVNTAVEKRKNPAEAVYKMAQRLGYKKPEPKKLEQIEKGVKASASLSTAQGKTHSTLTAETLAEMSDEEFWKLPYADFKKVMGG